MPVFLQLLNLDEMYESTDHKIIVNDLLVNDDCDNVKSLISTVYNSDVISIVPSCTCGEVKGEYNINTICTACGTPVLSKMSTAVKPAAWFAVPIGVQKFVHPHIWLMLSQALKTDLLDELVNNAVNVSTLSRNYMLLEKYPFPRSYNAFVSNFHEIMNWLAAYGGFKRTKKITLSLLSFLEDNKNNLFASHIPIPDKLFTIIESSNEVKYFDKSTMTLHDIVFMMIGERENIPINDTDWKKKERIAYTLLDKLADYNMKLNKNFLCSKTGLYRKHIDSMRGHFTFRTVVTSLFKGAYDEIHIPWGVGLTAMQPMVINKLLKRGMSMMAATTLIKTSIANYNSLLDLVMCELIAESKYGGIPCMIQRNPSLLSGSAQFVRVTKIKTDVEDRSTSFSILIVKPMNADFDGDELNFTLALDNYMAEKFKRLEPGNNVFMINTPYKMSGAFALPKPMVSTIHNFLVSPTDPPDPSKMDAMLTLT